MHRAYVDQDRTNGDGDQPRPIAATIWYPAASSSVASEWTIDVFRFGRSALDAPFRDTNRYPLIVVSHGTGGSVAQLSWLAEHLVLAGFVVAGVNHHGNTAAEDATSPAGFVLPGERARDLSVLIDRLLADAELAPHLDSARIAAAGFSLGGYTVLAAAGAHFTPAEWQQRCTADAERAGCRLPPEATFSIEAVHALAEQSAPFAAGLARGAEPVQDQRIRAVYAIAPALVGLLDRGHLSAVDVPTRVVLAEQDEQIDATTTADVISRYLPRAQLVRLAEAGHYAFLAPCTLRGKLFVRALCRDSRGVDRSDLHRRIGLDAASFFTTQLAP
jgi:predicted dienelactone hydrolase